MADLELDNGKQYVLGRGRVYFGRFIPGTTTLDTGRRYLGNTTAFNLSQSLDSLDHFDSDNGFKDKDDSVTISNAMNGAITTDNIASKNLALWFMGSAVSTLIAAGVGETQPITAGHDHYYQLGTTDATPEGFGNLTNVNVKLASGGNAIPAAGNWEVNLETGAFHVLPNAVAIPEKTPIIVTFDAVGATHTTVIASGTPLYGELFYEGRNPKGPNRDVLIPYVKLTPDGDYNFKGDDWQAMTFTVECLKLPTRERAYITRRTA